MKSPREKRVMSILANFLVAASVPLGETMKFSINKKYNEKIGIVLNNQHLKYLTQVKNRESLHFVFLFFLNVQNGHNLFFSLGTPFVQKLFIRNRHCKVKTESTYQAVSILLLKVISWILMVCQIYSI